MKTIVIGILFLLLLACKNKPAKQIPTNEKQNTSFKNSSSISLRRIGFIAFRRSFADLQFIKDPKEQDAYLQREEKANPILSYIDSDSSIVHQMQKSGFVKGDELLLKRFRHQTLSTSKLIDNSGDTITIRFAFLKGRLDAYQITAFNGSDSASQQTYTFTEELQYAFLDIVPGGNRELVVLNTYYVMNGYNFDFEVYEVSSRR